MRSCSSKELVMRKCNGTVMFNVCCQIKMRALMKCEDTVMKRRGRRENEEKIWTTQGQAGAVAGKFRKERHNEHMPCAAPAGTDSASVYDPRDSWGNCSALAAHKG